MDVARLGITVDASGAVTTVTQLGAKLQTLGQTATQTQAQVGQVAAAAKATAAASQAAAATITATGTAARAAGPNVGALKESFAAMVAQAAGAHPVLGRVTQVFGEWALGGPVLVGALAGIAAIGYGFAKLTEQSRNLKKQTDDALDSLRKAAEQRRLGEFGGAERDIAVAEKRLNDLRREERRIEATLSGGLAGESTGYLANRSLELTKERIRLEQDLADATAALTDAQGKDAATQRAADEKRRVDEQIANAKRLAERMDDLRTSARGTSSDLARIAEAYRTGGTAAGEAAEQQARWNQELRRATDGLDGYLALEARSLTLTKQRAEATADFARRFAEAAAQQRRIVDEFRANGAPVPGGAGTLIAQTGAIGAGREGVMQEREASGARYQEWMRDQARRSAQAMEETMGRLRENLQRGWGDVWTSFYDGGARSMRDLTRLAGGLLARLGGEFTSGLMMQGAGRLGGFLFGKGGASGGSHGAGLGGLDAIGLPDWLNRKNVGSAAGGALAGAFAGYGFGSLTGNQTTGAMGGAAMGAAAGAMLGPIGATVGALAGLTAGIIGAGEAAARARREFYAQRESADLAMERMRAEMSGDDSALRIIEERAKFDALREQQRAAYAGYDSELKKRLAEIDEAERKRIEQLKAEKDAIDSVTRSALNLPETFKLAGGVFAALNPLGLGSGTSSGGYGPGAVFTGGPSVGGSAAARATTVNLVVDGKVLASTTIKHAQQLAEQTFGDATRWPELIL